MKLFLIPPFWLQLKFPCSLQEKEANECFLSSHLVSPRPMFIYLLLLLYRTESHDDLQHVLKRSTGTKYAKFTMLKHNEMHCNIKTQLNDRQFLKTHE